MKYVHNLSIRERLIYPRGHFVDTGWIVMGHKNIHVKMPLWLYQDIKKDMEKKAMFSMSEWIRQALSESLSEKQQTTAIQKSIKKSG